MFYDYKCSCGNIQEERFPIGKAPEIVTCNHCNGNSHKKIIGVNFHMNTYVTQLNDFHKRYPLEIDQKVE